LSARTGPDLPRIGTLIVTAALGGWLGSWADPRIGSFFGGVCGGLLGLAAVSLARRTWPLPVRLLLVPLLLCAGFLLLWLSASFLAVTLGLSRAVETMPRS
jgi:hypothetical protein